MLMMTMQLFFDMLEVKIILIKWQIKSYETKINLRAKEKVNFVMDIFKEYCCTTKSGFIYFMTSIALKVAKKL